MEEYTAHNETKEKEAQELGVVINIEDEAKKEVDRLANLVAEKVELVSRVDEQHPAHISLFQGNVATQSGMAEVAKIVSDLLSEMGEVEIVMEDTLFVRPNGNIFWNVKASDVLMELHLKLLEKLHPLTFGLMGQFQDILDNPKTADTDKKQILKYGALLAGPKFLPHITLGKLKNLSDRERVENISCKPLSFKAKSLTPVKLNYDGSISLQK